MTAMRHGQQATELAAWPRSLPGESLAKWVEVDPVALRDNVVALKRLVGPKVAIMAMVKGNGYGHGAVLTARAALEGGASWLGVSAADEALQLRAAGIETPILVVGWTPPPALPALFDAAVDVTVASVDAVRAAAAAAAISGKRGRVQLKLDTGMGRFGVRPEELGALLDAVDDARTWIEVTGFFTHFAVADTDRDFTQMQNQRFNSLLPALRSAFPDAQAHAANSAALLEFVDTHYDMVRPGLSVYGYSPVPGENVLGLRPALSMFARISHLKTVVAGDTVGYGREWMAAGARRVATVAAGYADGIARAQGNRGAVLVSGVRCPIIGRVSMDQLSVDVSALEGLDVGDPVLIVGRDGDAVLGADTVATAIDTISYEVLTAISARVPRLVLDA